MTFRVFRKIRKLTIQTVYLKELRQFSKVFFANSFDKVV